MAEGRGLATVVNAGQTRPPPWAALEHDTGLVLKRELRLEIPQRVPLWWGGGWEEHDFRVQYLGCSSGCSGRRPAVTLHSAGLPAVLPEGELPG